MQWLGPPVPSNADLLSVRAVNSPFTRPSTPHIEAVGSRSPVAPWWSAEDRDEGGEDMVPALQRKTAIPGKHSVFRTPERALGEVREAGSHFGGGEASAWTQVSLR